RTAAWRLTRGVWRIGPAWMICLGSPRFAGSAPSAPLVARARCGRCRRPLAGAKARFPYPLRRGRSGLALQVEAADGGREQREIMAGGPRPGGGSAGGGGGGGARLG